MKKINISKIIILRNFKMDENFLFYLTAACFYNREGLLEVISHFFLTCSQEIHLFHLWNIESLYRLLREPNNLQDRVVPFLNENLRDEELKDLIVNSELFHFFQNFFNVKMEELNENEFMRMMVNLDNSLNQHFERDHPCIEGILYVTTGYAARLARQQNATIRQT
jgi:hypothetical protein